MLALLFFRGGGPATTQAVTNPPIVGGGWYYRPLKKKKKKLPKPVELEHVIVVPQEIPDYDAPVIYRHFGNLASDISQIRVQMIGYQQAMAFAKQENKRIEQEKSDELLILLAIMDDE